MVLMPRDFIELGLDVQSDMLFHSIFPDSELAKERKVVIEEIKKDDDNIDYQVALKSFLMLHPLKRMQRSRYVFP